MSSTNRGAVRQPDDLYVTPEWAARAILPHLGAPMRMLDPACGNGALLKAAASFWHARVDMFGMDIVHRGWLLTDVRDALSSEPWPKVDVILANPPYSWAMLFLERALQEAGPNGQVAFLLRLAWMAGQERSKFHRAHPSDVYVLPKRPSFTEHLRWHATRCPTLIPARKPGAKAKRCDCEFGHDGECMVIGTDSADYCWMVWGPGRGGHWSVLDVGREAA
jgi:hypothetical protein